MKPVLSRRLDLAESRNVALQYATHAETLKDEKLTLAPKAKAALKTLLAAGSLLQTLPATDSFQNLDREVDAAYSGFFRLFDALLPIFAGGTVPLTTAANAYNAAALRVERALRGHDRKLVLLGYREQHDAMRRFVATLAEPEVAAALATLHLDLAAARLGDLAVAYGRGLGFLETRGDDASSALGPFQDALAKLLLHVQADHDGEGDDARIRELLLAPYEDAVTRARLEDSKRRAKRKAPKSE